MLPLYFSTFSLSISFPRLTASAGFSSVDIVRCLDTNTFVLCQSRGLRAIPLKPPLTWRSSCSVQPDRRCCQQKHPSRFHGGNARKTSRGLSGLLQLPHGSPHTRMDSGHASPVIKTSPLSKYIIAPHPFTEASV